MMHDDPGAGEVGVQSMPMIRETQTVQQAKLASKAATSAKHRKMAKVDGLPRPGPHPSTAEIDYTANQLVFQKGVEEYKRRYGVKFPTLTEYLAIAEALGWSRRDGSWPAERVHEAVDEARGAVA